MSALLTIKKYPIVPVLNKLHEALGPRVEVGVRRDDDTYYIFVNKRTKMGIRKITRMYTIDQINALVDDIISFEREIESAVAHFKQELEKVPK